MYHKYNVLLKSSDYNTLRLDLLVVLVQLAYYQNTIQVYNSTNMLDRVPPYNWEVIYRSILQ